MDHTSERTQSAFLDQICTDLVLCQKKIALYPREHPQVRTALEDLRLAITRLADETRVSAVMETILIEDLAHCRAESAPGRVESYASLARLLKLHLIEEVRFEPGVSEEELYQFSCLLQEEFAHTPRERLDDFDPCAWTSIDLQFYTPQDFPDDLAAGDTLLGRAAGLSRSREVDGLLEQLPPMLAARVRQALVKPAFLRKVGELRRRLKEKHPDFEANEDLISRALKQTLPGLADSGAASAEEVLIRVDDYIRSVELDVDTREDAPVERYAPRVEESDFDILPVQHIVPLEVTERATDLRQVFGASASSEATRVLPSDEESDDGDEPPPARQQPTRETERATERPNDTLEELFRGIEYGELTWDAELDHDDERLQYLRVVLELLLEPSCRKVIGRNSTAVLESLTSEMNGAAFMEKVVAEVVGFSSTRKTTSTDELLAKLLDAVDSSRQIGSVMEDSVIPQSQDLATQTVDRLIERRPKRALELLMLLHRHPIPAIHRHAEASLLSLSKNPALLESWAREYPGGLVDPDVFSHIVERDSPERLIATFRDFFTHAPPETSLRLLRLITPELAGVDLILIPAIQFGPSEVHDYALSFLADSCLPVVTGTLIQTVRLNNYQERPSMREVEAALDALVRIDEPRAKRFLREVETSRSGWLRFEYRREIREALQRTLAREGRS